MWDARQTYEEVGMNDRPEQLLAKHAASCFTEQRLTPRERLSAQCRLTTSRLWEVCALARIPGQERGARELLREFATHVRNLDRMLAEVQRATGGAE